jgi:hypothetical protein
VIAADLDGDGREEVVTLVLSRDQQGWQTVPRVRAWSCKDQGELWTWSPKEPLNINATRHYYSNSDFEPQWLQRPQITIARGSSGPVLVLNLWSSNGRHLFLIDAKGNLVSHRTPAGSQPFLPLPYDVDGDNVDELIFYDGTAIQAMRLSDTASPVWRHELDVNAVDHLQLVPLRESNERILIAIGNAFDASIRALTPKTGDLLWRSPGTRLKQPNGAFTTWEGVGLLDHGTTDRPALIGIKQGQMTYCRAGGVPAMFVGPMSRSNVFKSLDDPRKARPLPWAHQNMGASIAELVTFSAWALYNSLALIVLPGWVLFRVVRNRRFSLRGLLLSPVLVALFAMALVLKPKDGDFATLITKFGLAALFLPVVALLATIGICLYRRRFTTLIRWLAVIVVGAFVIASAQFLVERNYSALSPDEYYSLGGWYVPLVPATYVTGLLIIATAPIQAMLRWRKRLTLAAKSIT